MINLTQSFYIASHWLPLTMALAVACITSGYLACTDFSFGQDKSMGVQKFHTRSTSRLGGVGIFLGIMAGVLGSADYFPNDRILGIWLLVSSAPIFIGGLIEDLTHKVSPRVRLVLASMSAAFAFLVLHLGVTRTDIPLIDLALGIPGISFLLTLLVVAGFINSMNIIDGFHGLAAGSAIIMLLGLASLSFIANDGLLLRLCLITAFATVGFLIWNWPYGKIFLGDGGAYLLGLWVVELGLLIPYRTLEISPMAPVMIGIYPLLETLFSMYRRKFIRSHPINHPDALHLHTLIYRRLILSPSLDVTSLNKNSANAKVALIVWGLVSMPVALALMFCTQTNVLLALIALFASLFVIFYICLINFKTPNFLISKRRKLGVIELRKLYRVTDT